MGKNTKGNRTYENSQVIARVLGRPPKVNEINQGPAMASYWYYYHHIGLKEDICNHLNILIPATIYHHFCTDCIYDNTNCGQSPFDCAREAELYFTV